LSKVRQINSKVETHNFLGSHTDKSKGVFSYRLFYALSLALGNMRSNALQVVGSRIILESGFWRRRPS